MLYDGCSGLAIQRPRGHWAGLHSQTRARAVHCRTRFCHNFSNQVLSQFVTILVHAEPSIVKEDFQVTIWTNLARFEYFFKIWKYNSSNPKLSEVSSKERSSIWGYLSSLPPGGDVNRGFWHWNEWKSDNVRPNSSVSGSRTKVMKHANCTCLSCT